MPRPDSISIIVIDRIGPVLDSAAAVVADRMLARAEESARDMQSYAQSNAPWADRTGDARSGLTAEAYREGLDIVITLSHSVDYGKWLEIKNDGEYAIILPTLEALGEEAIQNMGGEVIHVGHGGL